MTTNQLDLMRATGIGLTEIHQICSLKWNETSIGETGSRVRECRNGIEKREPSRRYVFRLTIKDILVSFPSIDVGGDNDESGKLEKDKVLQVSIRFLR